MQYLTRQNDVLDAIASRYFGVGSFDMDIIYNANPGLADLGTHIPAGTLINLPPNAGYSRQQPHIQLWD